MSTRVNVGSKVKRLREKSGLSQIQIAKFLGVDQSYISKCEKDERQFNVDSLEKLCNLFGCSMPDLINLDSPTETLNFAFRSSAIENDDLIAISDINKIALNIQQMRKLLGVN
jgi:transcriptional regulator with XRE-family HTH domain